MKAYLKYVVCILCVSFPLSAFADNCGSLSDCYGWIGAAVGIVALVASGAGIMYVLTVGGEAIAEAAAIGFMEGVAEVTAPATVTATVTIGKSLQHMFSRHARDFGFALSNWGKATATAFQQTVLRHISRVDPIPGTYRGTQQVLHYYDRVTGVNVMLDRSGNLVGGWKLSPDQINHLLSTGSIK